MTPTPIPGTDPPGGTPTEVPSTDPTEGITSSREFAILCVVGIVLILVCVTSCMRKKINAHYDEAIKPVRKHKQVRYRSKKRRYAATRRY